jgi:indoleamine 2,3-dioxygenase
VLYNWKRQDPSGPIVTSNMKALCHFLGGPDESWFYLQTVEIEAWGGPAMAALVEAQETVLLARNAAADGGAGMEVCLQHLALCLWKVADSVRSMRSALGRMYHGCRPREFYHVVRPFLSGWRGNPSLPGGVAYGECPDKREYCGGSAAQSSLFSALDAVLGIRHDASSCNNFLVEILDYMPPKHKAFILDLADESRPKIRMFIAGLMGSSADSARETLAAYDDAVAAMEEFRTAHISIVATYVIQQTPRDDSRANAPGDGKGTGGTPLLNFLRPLRDDSRIPLGGVP